MERLRILLTAQPWGLPFLWILGLFFFSVGTGQGFLYSQNQEARNEEGFFDPSPVVAQAMNLYWQGLDGFSTPRSQGPGSQREDQNLNQSFESWADEAEGLFQQWFMINHSDEETREFVYSSFPLLVLENRLEPVEESDPQTSLIAQKLEILVDDFFLDLWNLGIALTRPENNLSRREVLAQLLDLERTWGFLSPNPQGISIQIASVPLMLAIHQSPQATAFVQSASPFILSQIRQIFSGLVMEWENQFFNQSINQISSSWVQGDYQDPWGFILLREAAVALRQSTELELAQLELQLRKPGLTEEEMHWHWLSLLQDRRAAQQVLVRTTGESDQFLSWLEKQIADFIAISRSQVQSRGLADSWLANGSILFPEIATYEQALKTYQSFFRQADMPGPIETLRVLSYWGIVLEPEVVDDLLIDIQQMMENQSNLLLRLPENQFDHFINVIEELDRSYPRNLGDQSQLSSLTLQFIPLLSLIEDPIEHLALFDRFLLGLRIRLLQSNELALSRPRYDKSQYILRVSLRILDELFDGNLTAVETIHLLHSLTETESIQDLIQTLDQAFL